MLSKAFRGSCSKRCMVQLASLKKLIPDCMGLLISYAGIYLKMLDSSCRNFQIPTIQHCLQKLCTVNQFSKFPTDLITKHWGLHGR